MNEYMTIAEAADYLGVSRQRVGQFLKQGRLPYQMLGERLKAIPANAVEALAEVERKPGRPKQKRYLPLAFERVFEMIDKATEQNFNSEP